MYSCLRNMYFFKFRRSHGVRKSRGISQIKRHFRTQLNLRFVQALRGNDVVGSSVRIKLQKPSGKFFECTVQRGSIARIQAIGDLFLMLTEMISGIQNRGKKPTVGDIMG